MNKFIFSFIVLCIEFETGAYRDILEYCPPLWILIISYKNNQLDISLCGPICCLYSLSVDYLNYKLPWGRHYINFHII